MTDATTQSPPLQAAGHCRFYSYRITNDPRSPEHGPQCARGIDLSYPGSALMCMPGGGQPRGLCSQREEFTEEERAAWEAWAYHHIAGLLAGSAEVDFASEPK